MSDEEKQQTGRCFTSTRLPGPLNNKEKAKLLCVINPRWEQSGQSASPHTNLPLQSTTNPQDKRDRDHLTSAGLSSLEVPLQPHRELQGALRSVQTCSVCPDPAPALSLEAVQWSNGTAQLHPKYNCPGHKQRLWKRAVDCSEPRQLTSSLKKAASLCCSE